jgi:cyclohexa-1,5-dienecarbonyl-CoA hydratase
MAADVLLAGERAKFGQPEILIGFFAPLGVAYLPALVGTAKAMEITCSGRTYSGADMKECGFVTKVVPSDELATEREGYLDDFRKASPTILRMNVRLLKRLRGRPYEEARREAERVFLEELMATEDVREGIASFKEKRKPSWKNK